MDRWRQGLSSIGLLCEGRQEYSLQHQRSDKALKQASFEDLTVDLCNVAFCFKVKCPRAAIFGWHGFEVVV